MVIRFIQKQMIYLAANLGDFLFIDLVVFYGGYVTIPFSQLTKTILKVYLMFTESKPHTLQDPKPYCNHLGAIQTYLNKP